jgi:hypothetical protein
VFIHAINGNYELIIINYLLRLIHFQKFNANFADFTDFAVYSTDSSYENTAYFAPMICRTVFSKITDKSNYYEMFLVVCEILGLVYRFVEHTLNFQVGVVQKNSGSDFQCLANLESIY